jgi:hypothetical protein
MRLNIGRSEIASRLLQSRNRRSPFYENQDRQDSPSRRLQLVLGLGWSIRKSSLLTQHGSRGVDPLKRPNIRSSMARVPFRKACAMPTHQGQCCGV